MPNDSSTLTALEARDDFIHRHIGPGPADQAQMLAELGLDSLDALLDRVVPASIRRDDALPLPGAASEQETLARLREIANKNRIFKSFIGMGYAASHTPPVIQRNILENPAWYTAYTPYQAEISQGRMEAMLNFQTMVADLTGLALANASLLDEATAAAEAMTLCQRMAKSRGKVFFVAEDCHPQTIAVVQTRAPHFGIEVVVGDPARVLGEPDGAFGGLDIFGVLLQYPGTTGAIRDYRALCSAAHEKKALVAVACDLLALTLLTPPGEFGADVAIGNSQRFGVPLGFGGPHAAFMATRDAFKRSMPGRLIGVSVDSRGQPALRLALQTREQHIRREKATSNICTAQALLAVMASMYAVFHGPEGLLRIARRVHRLTALLAAGLEKLGWPVPSDAFFDTIVVITGEHTAGIHAAARERGINLRELDAQTIGIALDETATAADIQTLWSLFSSEPVTFDIAALDAQLAARDGGDRLPQQLLRESEFLSHPVFHSHRSETKLLRYMRKLADKDLALDRAMIPLGSCTMKLNATSEMLPISWPEFAAIHPCAPLDQVAGYRQLFSELEEMLCACTGYDAVSLQPNSGAQGEYAGLLAIKGYHASRGEGHRHICLIPASAHGTNPASAQMAGMKVVVVATAGDGGIDLDDLRAKAQKHSDDLAAIMITYPSTHGVFEEAVREVCEIVHQHGGQVYMDGANLNAMVGVCAPGRFGGDVSHLNLHKTFCIPHGGGGPGVGPIGVGAHLAPFLPGDPLDPAAGAVGPVAGARWGSAGILPISWAYIAMMGAAGLTRATAVAILSANYIAARLAEHFPVLYTGPNGMVAHECIIDLRPLKERCGVTVDDVAKRLIDYGFHAPTMSFPVPGTLMIEPTESESKQELDRFCDAMIAIRGEIRALENGDFDLDDNPLRNAPHTVDQVCGDSWEHPYSRELAAFPVPALRDCKYWSPVGRVDNVHGDKHLICACPPLSAYAD
mgnify:CR=1 FL=1